MSEILETVYGALAALLPGFIALHAGHRLFGLQVRMGDLEKSTWSLLLSIMILGLFLVATGHSAEQLAADPSPLLAPRGLALLAAFVVAGTAVVYVWLRTEPLDKLSQGLWKGSPTFVSRRPAWETYLKESVNKPLTVETTTKKFYGELVGYGFVEGERALCLNATHVIVWDDAKKHEVSHAFEVALLIPYEHVVSVYRDPPTP